LNHDLGIGQDTAEFKMLTEGTAPNRITTIQFKNLTDKINTQYLNLEFQIKLYETSNVIEFVYGSFIADGNPVAVFKTATVGLKGNSNEENQLLNVNKTWSRPWENANYQNGNYQDDEAFRFTNRNIPLYGFTYRFSPNTEHDLMVRQVYSLGKTPTPEGNPQTISAIIKNVGRTTISNFNVNLNISGANTFSQDIFISQLLPDKDSLISFNLFFPTELGNNNIAVSVPNDDNNSNNSFNFGQETTDNIFAYADTSAVTTAVGGASGRIYLTKYHLNGTKRIVAVNSYIFAYPSNVGNTVYAVVLDANHNIVASSNVVTISEPMMGKMNRFAINLPPTPTDTDFLLVLRNIPRQRHFIRWTFKKKVHFEKMRIF